MKTNKCTLCNSIFLDKIIDLGNHPLADSFLNKKQSEESIIHYPLNVVLCRECGHAMLGYIVPAEERYRKVDYSYTASNSKVSLEHFSKMANELGTKFHLKKQDLVVDIGSNDGTLLNFFKSQFGSKVIGFEPSRNIAKIAKSNGVVTLCDFFGERSASVLAKKSRAKIITATNVFNHISDYQDFVRGIKKLLDNDGHFIFEVPYFAELINKGAFDTIYLEHTSYFTMKAFDKFFKKNGMSIVDAEVNDYMGGSIRVTVVKGIIKSDKIDKFIKDEIKLGLFKLNTYDQFIKRIVDFKIRLVRDLLRAKEKNDGAIVGIGAATKGNTLLNFCKIDNNMVDFITDGSPLKVGKYMPGSNIPIYDDSKIDATVKYALILPWNIADFLKSKFKDKKIKFIIPEFK